MADIDKNMVDAVDESNANEIKQVSVGGTVYDVVDAGAGRSITATQTGTTATISLKDKSGNEISSADLSIQGPISASAPLSISGNTISHNTALFKECPSGLYQIRISKEGHIVDAVSINQQSPELTGNDTFLYRCQASGIMAHVPIESLASYTKGRISASVTGTGNAVTNVSYSNGNITATKGLSFLETTLKGAANGVAELGSDGKIPSAQLPSYVDDVLEFDSQASFPATGETGKIYIAKDTNKTYRWSGTQYVEISASLALGETSSTAYRGDYGKIAYDHSQSTHAPSNAEPNQNAYNTIRTGVHGETYLTASSPTDSVCFYGRNIGIHGEDGTGGKMITFSLDSTGVSGALGYTPAGRTPVNSITDGLTPKIIPDSTTMLSDSSVILMSPAPTTNDENKSEITATWGKIPTASSTVNGLMTSTDKFKLDHLSTVATTGSYSDLTTKPFDKLATPFMKDLDGNLTASMASSFCEGLMSKNDKVKLDGIETGAKDNVFWATRGTTTAAEVETAINEGKIVKFIYSGYEYSLVSTTSTHYYFSHATTSAVRQITLKKSNSTWSGVSTLNLQAKLTAGDGIDITDSTISGKVATSLSGGDVPKVVITEGLDSSNIRGASFVEYSEGSMRWSKLPLASTSGGGLINAPIIPATVPQNKDRMYLIADYDDTGKNNPVLSWATLDITRLTERVTITQEATANSVGTVKLNKYFAELKNSIQTLDSVVLFTGEDENHADRMFRLNKVNDDVIEFVSTVFEGDSIKFYRIVLENTMNGWNDVGTLYYKEI